MARRKNENVGYTIAPEASAPPAAPPPASSRLRPLKIGRDPDSCEVAIESGKLCFRARDMR